MSVDVASGVISLTTGAIGTTFTVSGLSFQPKAIVLVWNRRNATGIAEADMSAGVGLITGTSSRRAYGFQIDHARAGNDRRNHVWRDDCCVTTITTTGTVGGHVDINAINSDGFELIIDDVLPAAMVVGWIAYGGSDITDVALVDWQLRTTTGDTDVATGFALNTGEDDKAVIAVGIRASDAAGTIAAASSLSVAIAAGDSIQQASVAYIGSEASDPSLTDAYGRLGDFIVSINSDDAVYARESLTTWLADGFRVNTVETPGFALRRSAIVMKGGRWEVGSFTTSTGTSNADEATTYAPKGIFFISHCRAESTSDTADAGGELSLGVANSAADRWAFFMRDADASAASNVAHAFTDAQFYYNGAAAAATEDGTADLVDFAPASGNGFTWVMDNGDPSAAWVGYLVAADGEAGPISGELTKTLAAVTSAATGVLPIVGTSAPTLGTATLSSVGALDVAGMLGGVMEPATLAAAGMATPLNGTATPTLADVTLSSTGLLPIVGTSAPTLAAVTLSSTGLLDVAGTLGGVLEPVTLAATGGLPLIEGALSVTLGSVTLSAVGELDVAGLLGGVLDPATLSSTGLLPIVGTATPTLSAVTLSSTGLLDVAGTLGGVLDPVTLAATGQQAGSAEGDLAVTLAAVTLSGTGLVDLAALLGGELEPVTLASAGALPIVGTSAPTLAAVTLSSEAHGPLAAIEGELTATLAGVTLLSTGTMPRRSRGGRRLSQNLRAPTAPRAARGKLAATLDDVHLFARAVTNKAGAAAVTLGDAAAVSTATLDWSDVIRQDDELVLGLLSPAHAQRAA